MANEQSGVFMEDGYALRQPPYNDSAHFSLSADYVHVGTLWELLNTLVENENSLGLSLQIDGGTLLVPFAGNYLVTLCVTWYNIINTTKFGLNIRINGLRKILKEHYYVKFDGVSSNVTSHFSSYEQQLEAGQDIQLKVRSGAAGRIINSDPLRTFVKIDLLSKNEATP